MSEQATIKYIQAPLTAETIKDLHAGDVVRISGYIDRKSTRLNSSHWS